ncbi:exo-beta-N-acetylmuramidase NamZ domain-containing protein [Pseudoalteromonas luteoviolacea]|uniref:DUF1343 domain-containing protein n=1 Tax=Pseudoalteromonas luteoviolacea (strain 2ta16) TaxID=1353533 RepID=V4HQJ2_PSEL2|nr:DUF1343 domain-containing protein [Pseudoalteromonas luteoviolacea]ESP93090.1 hypothetical protein PL2TA16_03726 [Pseudoalteromonas luteoviolacea 2ta16]KZN31573.1 hypothetical protein N483_27135 [Pseudoalteromonas luteoviolacea NCIMB 1944]
MHFFYLKLCVLILLVLHTKIAIAIEVGAQQPEKYLSYLENKRVGLVVNQSSRVADMHLVDFLLANNVKVERIFSPEHGFRGDQDAGAHIDNSFDVKTGLSIVSLYGKQKRPTKESLQDLDVLIFDIQDVGVRFYTYISTMHYMMQAAKDYRKKFIVLDRPNPNIRFVDGPVLNKKFSSFVGMHPIPILHGMTVGELAQMIVGEGWLSGPNKLDLNVVAVKSYQASDEYILPIAPSPNLPNQQSIYLYSSLCLFEATAVSIGRGTDFPFQVYGHDQVQLGDFKFSPRSIVGAARFPKLEGKSVWGKDLRQSSLNGFDLSWFIEASNEFKQRNKQFITSPKFLDKLAGTDIVRLAVEQGLKAHQIEAIFQQEVSEFKKRRAPYLLYSR